MLQHTLWVLALGLGLVLLGGAPAQASSCGHSCGKKNDELRGKKDARDGYSIQLKSTKGGDRFAAHVPVDKLPRELSGSTKKKISSVHLRGLSKRDDHGPLPKGLPGKGQPDPGQSAIPEPTGLLLFAGGLLVARAAMRRHRI